MGDLIVRPSYQLSERDILTVDKLNLMATPVVELALEAPVNDQNFFRNGNFYSSFWITPAGIDCPIGANTENASYWFCTPQGGTVNYARDIVVPDTFSLFSAKLTGQPTTSTVEFGARIVGDLAATLRRPCTFSSYIKNDTGLLLSPHLVVYTCDAFNDFDHVTAQGTYDIPTVTPGAWGYETVTVDLSTLTNVANGLYITVLFPSGSLNGTSKVVHLSRLKFQIGEVATEFADDGTLFNQSPTVGAIDLQDGCIARPGLFLPQVIPPGAYIPGSIAEGDIAPKAIDNPLLADGSVDTRVLADAGITLQKLAAALITYLLPPGTIWPYGGPIIPTDWLECIGGLYSRTDPRYINLWNAIGVTWGAGDGITTFGIPDFRGLDLIGAGQRAGLTNRLLGQILVGAGLGEESHQLTATETPVHNHVATVNENPHSHTYQDNGHVHPIPYKANTQLVESGGGSNVCDPGGSLRFNSGNSPTGILINPVATNLSVSISNVGGNGKHNNMQPGAVVKWMIRL